jgi:hypothetical protein
MALCAPFVFVLVVYLLFHEREVRRGRQKYCRPLIAHQGVKDFDAH